MNLIKRLKAWINEDNDKPIGNISYWSSMQEYHKSRFSN